MPKAPIERLYLEGEILRRAADWVGKLVEKANLQTQRTLLWPPASDQKAAVVPAPSKARSSSALIFTSATGRSTSHASGGP